VHEAVGGDVPPEAVEEGARARLGVVDGIEQLQREGELERVRRVVHRLDGGEAEPRGLGQPRVSGDGHVVGGDAVGGRCHHGGDLQRRHRRIGLRPPPCRTGGFRERKRERQSAVGQADRRQPVAQVDGSRRRDRGDVREHLEGVQRGARLALGGAQIGLESPAIAAVGIAVAVERGQGRRRVAVAKDQLEAAAVQDASVRAHERRGRR
jgi:hypothetical protein